MKRFFTTSELKMTKYNLMKKGFSESQAEQEVANMIDCNEEAHDKSIKEKKHEKRYKVGRFKEQYRSLKNENRKT